MKTYIYTLESNNIIRYVGKTTNTAKRMKEHLCLKGKEQSYLKNWISRELAKGNKIKMEMLDETVGDWRELEQYWISQFKTWGFRLCNLTKGGDGADGYKHTNESKAVMSEIHKGKTPWNKGVKNSTWTGGRHTEAAKRVISEKQKGELNHNHGKITPPEIIAKIRATSGAEVRIGDIVYQSKRFAAKELSMSWSTFRYRLRVGSIKTETANLI